MKKYKLIWAIWIAAAACVQPSKEKTVVVTVTVPGLKGIRTVGLRGEGNPLSWRKDYPLTAIVPDSLYTTTFTTRTAYDFTDIKFTVDGQFEREGKENRRLAFNTGDTTYYRAVFNLYEEK